jgi:hypothetical protein
VDINPAPFGRAKRRQRIRCGRRVATGVVARLRRSRSRAVDGRPLNLLRPCRAFCRHGKGISKLFAGRANHKGGYSARMIQGLLWCSGGFRRLELRLGAGAVRPRAHVFGRARPSRICTAPDPDAVVSQAGGVMMYVTSECISRMGGICRDKVGIDCIESV